MTPQVLFYSYISAGVLGLVLLLVFGRKAWYWHFGSLLAGLGVGLIRPPYSPAGDVFYLVAGMLCLFLVAWGGGAIFLGGRSRRRSSA